MPLVVQQDPECPVAQVLLAHPVRKTSQVGLNGAGLDQIKSIQIKSNFMYKTLFLKKKNVTKIALQKPLKEEAHTHIHLHTLKLCQACYTLPFKHNMQN